MDWTPTNLPEMTGKTVLITGGNSGIGFEAAKVFCRQGGRVIIACRNTTKAPAAIGEIESAVAGANIGSVALDLASQASVKRAVEAIKSQSQRIDVLVNNAGIMAIPRRVTEDGFEYQFGANHLGHFTFAAGLFPLVEKAQGRVVVVGSAAHKFARIDFDDLMGEKKYSRMGNYGASKLATMLFARELHRRSQAAGSSVKIVMCHPGFARTHLQNPKNTGLTLWFLVGLTTPFLSQSADQGAWPTLFAALAPEALGGVCYGPTRRWEMVGPVGVSQMAPQLLDSDSAKRLWEVSESLTGIPFSLAIGGEQA